MPIKLLDTSGLYCPMPLLKTKLQLNDMAPGELLEVISTDSGSARDIPAFLKSSLHSLERVDEDECGFRFLIRCGGDPDAGIADAGI